MPRFSTISDNISSFSISTFKDIFDRFNFVKIAKKLRIEIRHRKFSFGEFIPLVFSKLCEHQKEHVLSLEELRLEYRLLISLYCLGLNCYHLNSALDHPRSSHTIHGE